MPVSTPNRVADPVSLEAFVAPCILRQDFGGHVNWYNDTGATVIAGEPVNAFGQICIATRTILPGKMGVLATDWIVDALLDTAHSGDILQGALVYWDTDLDAVTPIEGGSAVAGIGAASASVPGNGFILGRACASHTDLPSVNGSNKLKCAVTGSVRVQVVSIPGAPTTYTS